MKNYIGTKTIKAKPMTRLEYNNYRGWELPSDENGEDKGYLVEYLDSPNKNHPDHEGYISWSPKDVFEKAYKETNGLTFGQAIEALKKGLKVARKGWNGKGMFVFKQIPATVPLNAVMNMTSLPDSVKDVFINREKCPNYCNQMAIVKLDGSIDSWVASSSDTFAEDWEIVQ